MNIPVVFGLYLVMLPLFAGVYYALYRRDSANFVFAEDIFRTRLEDRTKETEQNIASCQLLLTYFRAFLGASEATGVRFARDEDTYIAPLADGRQVVLKKQVRYDPPGVESEILPYIQLVTSHGRVEWEGRAPHPGFFLSHFTDADSYVRASTQPLAEMLEARESELAHLRGPKPTVWRFVDFLYFSIITQSTVGYGDILPNSSLVRSVVLTQILLGYAVLVLVLNLVLLVAT